MREGRLDEFGNWQSFSDPGVRARIPGPNAMATFEVSKIDWSERTLPKQRQRLALVKRLLEIRRREIAPRLARLRGNAGQVLSAEDSGLAVGWRLGDGSDLLLVANLSGEAWAVPPALPKRTRAAGRLLYATEPGCEAGLQSGTLPPWSVVVRIVDAAP